MSKQILSSIGYISRVCIPERSPNEFLERFAVLGAKVLGHLDSKVLVVYGGACRVERCKAFLLFQAKISGTISIPPSFVTETHCEPGREGQKEKEHILEFIR